MRILKQIWTFIKVVVYVIVGAAFVGYLASFFVNDETRIIACALLAGLCIIVGEIESNCIPDKYSYITYPSIILDADKEKKRKEYFSKDFVPHL